MDLNSIKEIGFLYNAKVENINTKTLEKRDLLVFIFTDNTTKYLDIEAGRELLQYEKVVCGRNTKLNKIYKNKDSILENFQSLHPTLNIKIENRCLKSPKERG